MQYAIKKAVNSQPRKHFIIVATHNEAAIKDTTVHLHRLNAPRHPNVAFAQIYGMAEHISLPLGKHYLM